MKEVSKTELKSVLDVHPMHPYMRRFAENNQSVAIMAYRMLLREQKSSQTLRRYFEAVKRFSLYLNVSEDADKALSQLKQSKNPVDVVDGFIEHLQATKKLSPVSIKSLFYGVKKWLEENQVSLDWNLVSRPKVSSRIKDRCPTRDELRRIFVGTTHRDRALFLTCVCSGLRIGTAIRLQIKDVKPLSLEKDIEFDGAIVNVEGGEGRKLGEGNWYFTFITGEAWTAIQDYLASRKNTNPEEPLFAASTKEQGFYHYSNNVTRQWRKLCRRAGLTKKVEGHTWTELHTHVLRKYFQTSCKIAGISPSYYDFWLGHISTRAETNLDDSYFRAQLKTHVVEYKKALKDLTVFEDISTNEEVQDLKVTVKQLQDLLEHREGFLTGAIKFVGKGKNEELTAQDNVIARLEKRVKELEDKNAEAH